MINVTRTRHAAGKISGARLPAALAAVLALSLVLAGCGQSQAPADAVSGTPVNEPLESPAWDSQQDSILAIRQADRSLVKVDLSPSGIIQGEQVSQTVSEQLDGLGENFAPDLRESGQVYVPQPELEQVSVIGATDLLTVRSFEAGPAPSQVVLAGPVTQASGASDTLLALSQDGSTVTGVTLDSFEESFQQSVDVGSGAILGASGAAGQSFWAAGSEGVVFSDGSTLAGPPENLELDASALAVDPQSEVRAYVGESASGRLHALEASPAGGLQVAGEAELGSDVEQLGISDGLLYAATNEGVVGLEPESLDVAYTAEFGQPMREAVSGRPVPSGMAFSEENVYLTLEGSPYVVEVGKP